MRARSFGPPSVRVDARDHLADLGEIAGADVRAVQEVLDQLGDVAVEQALRQLTDHRVLHLWFGHRGAVVVLAGLGGGPPGYDAAALEPREHGGDGGLSEPALGVQGFPDVFDRRFALDRKSTRLNSSHSQISYAVCCLK